MPIDDATRDVTPCEQLIIQIRHIYIQISQGKKLEEMPIKWDYIDKLKSKCNVLPSDYVAMLAELESHRPNPNIPTPTISEAVAEVTPVASTPSIQVEQAKDEPH